MARFYVDEVREYVGKGLWCHLWTPDGTDRELDAFARLLGLRKSWAHTSHGMVGRFYHYDLTPRKRVEALGYSAVCSEKSLAEWIKEVRDENRRSETE